MNVQHPMPTTMPPWKGLPESVTCTCGSRFVVGILLGEGTTHPRLRDNLLGHAASNEGWYQFGTRVNDPLHAWLGQWACPSCYASQVVEADMLRRVGQREKMQATDVAAARRAAWCELVVAE